MKISELDKRCLERFGWFYALILLREMEYELKIKQGVRK